MSETDAFERPLTVLFICTANICRSLYAEGRTKQLLGGASTLVASSAGTHGFVDQPLDAEMAVQLALRGEVAPLSSRRLTGEIARGADIILTATAAHRMFVLDEWPSTARRLFTLDQCAQALASCTEGLTPREAVRAAYERRGPADPAGDIADPYRRGRAAAERAAERIDELLAAIVPRLLG